MNPRFLDDMSWQMTEVYEATVDRILINMAKYFPLLKEGAEVPGGFQYQARMLAQLGKVNRETVDILTENLQGADQALRGILEAAIMDALKNEEPKLQDAARKGLTNGEGFLPPEVTLNQFQAFQSYYRQSADKLNLVNTRMLQSTQSAYTATVSDIVGKINRTQSILNVATGEVVTGVQAFNSAVRSSVQKMVENGLTGFIDRGGHHWSPEAYVAMDIRTTLANTARSAVFEESERFGVDLYQVSHHDGARPLCYPWQGKVISRSDWTGTVTDDSGNDVHVYAQSETSYGEAAGLFGINCGHYPISFIPGYSRIRPPEQNEEENAKEYEESQQQRALERKLRAEKRDLAVLKAQGAPEEEIKAQREKAREASRNLDDFCEQTGRARRRNREATPIKASWPEIAGAPPTGGSGGPPTVGPSGQGSLVGGKVPQGQQVMALPKAPEPPKAPSTVTIAGAKDFDELSEAIKTKFNVTVDQSVKQLDFDKIKTTMTGVESIIDEFPEVGNNLEDIISSRTGVMACNGRHITFNPKYYDSGDALQDAITGSVASGWWPKNTSVPSIGVHEAGHGVEYAIIQKSPEFTYSFERSKAWNDCTVAKRIVSEAIKNIKKTAFGKGKKKLELLQTISGYASMNASESIAESFADVYSNGTQASPVAIEIRRLTKELYDTVMGGKK